MGGAESKSTAPPPYRPYLLEPGSDTAAPVFNPLEQRVNDALQKRCKGSGLKPDSEESCKDAYLTSSARETAAAAAAADQAVPEVAKLKQQQHSSFRSDGSTRSVSSKRSSLSRKQSAEKAAMAVEQQIEQLVAQKQRQATPDDNIFSERSYEHIERRAGVEAHTVQQAVEKASTQ
eukprot:15890-Heterococcus_DN1.PRE.3